MRQAFRSNALQYKPRNRDVPRLSRIIFFLRVICQLIRTSAMKEPSRTLAQVLHQASPTPASLLSNDAAHIFDNAAVEFQLSADREEMVAPGTIDKRETYTGFCSSVRNINHH